MCVQCIVLCGIDFEVREGLKWWNCIQCRSSRTRDFNGHLFKHWTAPYLRFTVFQLFQMHYSPSTVDKGTGQFASSPPESIQIGRWANTNERSQSLKSLYSARRVRKRGRMRTKCPHKEEPLDWQWLISTLIVLDLNNLNWILGPQDIRSGLYFLLLLSYHPLILCCACLNLSLYVSSRWAFKSTHLCFLGMHSLLFFLSWRGGGFLRRCHCRGGGG